MDAYHALQAVYAQIQEIVTLLVCLDIMPMARYVQSVPMVVMLVMIILNAQFVLLVINSLAVNVLRAQ